MRQHTGNLIENVSISIKGKRALLVEDGMVMTSTQVDEEAQHFYRKLGYKECGGFTVDIPGYEQPMEMLMSKAL